MDTLRGIKIPMVNTSGNSHSREEVLPHLAARVRGCSIELSHRAETPHLGSALSCADILAVLYGGALNLTPHNILSPSRDRCILSKGHAAIALYSVLALQGFLDPLLLDSYAESGSSLAEQPIPGIHPAIEVATGSLGHGLPIGAGIATAGKIKRSPFRTVVLLSDGECNEGSVWEAALFAAAQELSTLTVIIDYNKWQATGRSEEVLGLRALRAKWESFGWWATEVDGHNVQEIGQALAASRAQQAPSAIVAHTVKGKGVSFMEDDNNWHYRIPSQEEFRKACGELGIS